MSCQSKNTKRIAKNTLLLYFRMLLTILVSLYTSRVILQSLGVEDYGIYNVVGGVVGMFSVLSGTLSSAIGRFIAFELGKGNKQRLINVFSTSLTIQFTFAVIILLLAEVIGVWFINQKMNIAVDRLNSAIWVFHFSILTFIVSLLSVPYNAAIVAHEKMSVFAYISIIEVFSKLIVAYFINIAPIDKLVFYALLMWIVAIIIRIIYMLYCKRHFEECTYHFIWDKQLIRQMFSFAGWNFIGSSSTVLREQGSNLILNLFFGTTINAARGIAFQIYSTLYSFVSNIVIAINPQITKSYACGDYKYMMNLIYRGSRFACYLLFMISLPILIKTEYILYLWLGLVPEETVLFVRLMIIFALSEAISSPLITAQLATGNIRNYQLVVGGIEMLNLPLSYMALKLYEKPEYVFVVAIIISQVCLATRLYILRGSIKLSAKTFLKEVYINIFIVYFIASIIPIALSLLVENTLICFAFFTIISLVSTASSVLFVGCNETERIYFKDRIHVIVKRIANKK